ncbi:MAG: MBL fold metallo-hydrolase [Parachlamydia sp.]|nr:MBL fold metallo-hydrolase [Parachlamydia sp.]
MKIKTVGAAGGEVTGSAYLIETSRAKVLVDAGMFQGGRASEEKNKLPEGADPTKLDALLLTHAHLDHTGRAPLLIKHGFRGPIFATAATIDLSEIILADSAKIQMQDAARKTRKQNHDDPPFEPLYSAEDLIPYRSMAKTIDLHQPIPVADGITARFFEAGHMLGSTSIELTVQENGQNIVIVFSGDLGPIVQPIVRQFEPLPYADFVFMESTYGDRDHRPYTETIQQFEQIIKTAVEQKGKMLIPAFAIGRTQQILYHLAILFHEKKIAPFPVYVDSPMAIEAGKVFALHPDLFDEEAVEMRKQGVFPLDRNWFRFSTSVEDSKQLNEIQGPCIILAGSGMCSGGRIQHHLKFNLPDPHTHVLIVGYQGYGSLGRQLVDGAQRVRIHGEHVDVRATVHTLNGLSAHAGQSDLLQWFSSLGRNKPRVALTHGEDTPREALAAEIQKRYGIIPVLPKLNEVLAI